VQDVSFCIFLLLLRDTASSPGLAPGLFSPDEAKID
jgi:hypothetical protein